MAVCNLSKDYKQSCCYGCCLISTNNLCLLHINFRVNGATARQETMNSDSRKKSRVQLIINNQLQFQPYFILRNSFQWKATRKRFPNDQSHVNIDLQVDREQCVFNQSYTNDQTPFLRLQSFLHQIKDYIHRIS